MDNPKLMTEEKLEILKKYAIKEAKKVAAALGINVSTAVTTGKPSGTVSQLVNSASGAHARHSRWYIRRYRLAGTDPLFSMMKDQGVKFTPENGQGPESVDARRKEMVEKYGRTAHEAKLLVPDWDESKVNTWVCSFPIESPKGCLTREDVSALDQLEWYLKLRKSWCEHNQSVTVYVKDEEWMRVGAWVYDHFDELVGVSFLPYDGGHYEQAPYEEITKEQYEKLASSFPKIDYTQLSRYELEDGTMGAKELACSGGACEIA
jgi:ribonucleoside-diphosphate reductase alpha chain